MPIRKPEATMAGMMGTKMSPSVLMACWYQGALAAAACLTSSFVDFVYRAGAEDDLQLTLGLKDALGPLGVLEGLFVHLVVVRNDQAQAGCAVGCRYDVGRAADGIQYLLCRVFVIHENRSFYKM